MLPLWSLSDTNRQENQLLIEALMGFQFNQVGGGTKTRRPMALRMQYNPPTPGNHVGFFSARTKET
jgi:hypothetical protein